VFLLFGIIAIIAFTRNANAAYYPISASTAYSDNVNTVGCSNVDSVVAHFYYSNVFQFSLELYDTTTAIDCFFAWDTTVDYSGLWDIRYKVYEHDDTIFCATDLILIADTNLSHYGSAVDLTVENIVEGIFEEDLTGRDTPGTLGRYADTTISSISLTGTGQYPCSIYVKNTAGGVVPALGLNIVSDVGVGSGTPTSQSDGWALASLDNGTYFVYASNPSWITSTPACTLSFSSGTHYNDTLWATAFDYGAGATGALCNVYVNVYDNSGNGRSGVDFSARLNRARARVKTSNYFLISYAVSDTTDTNGTCILPLWVNDSIVSSSGTSINTKYVFNLRDSLGYLFQNISVEVPGDSAGGSWELTW